MLDEGRASRAPQLFASMNLPNRRRRRQGHSKLQNQPATALSKGTTERCACSTKGERQGHSKLQNQPATALSKGTTERCACSTKGEQADRGDRHNPSRR